MGFGRALCAFYAARRIRAAAPPSYFLRRRRWPRRGELAGQLRQAGDRNRRHGLRTCSLCVLRGAAHPGRGAAELFLRRRRWPRRGELAGQLRQAGDRNRRHGLRTCSLCVLRGAAHPGRGAAEPRRCRFAVLSSEEVALGCIYFSSTLDIDSFRCPRELADLLG